MSVTVPPRSWPTDEASPANCMVLTVPVAHTSHVPSPHSASVSQGPPHPLAHPHRRSLHSPGMRKPLRSSPLAGPVLLSDGPRSEVTNAAKSRPSRISSTPDLASLLAHPPPVRRARPRTAESPQSYFSLSAPPTAFQTPLKSPPSSAFAEKNLLIQGRRELTRPSSLVKPSPPASSLELRPPSTHPDDPTYRTIPPPLAAVRRPKTAHGYPTHSPPPMSPNPSSVERIPSVHSRDPRDNSWFITNPYETTPKFSRLGLASSNVVLPVSAKEHKRLAHRNSKSSVTPSTTEMAWTESTKSSPDASPSLAFQQDTLSLPSPRSPSPSMPRCNRSNSASDSLASLQPREVSGITTIAEGDESHLRHHSTSKPTLSHRSVPPTLPKKGPLSRFKVLSLQTIRSSGSLSKLHPTPISEKLTTDPSQIPQSEIKLGFFTSRSGSPTASESTVESQSAEPGKAASLLLKRGSGVKKIWRSITSWQRNRS